jgi:hypothetical protein
MELDADEVEASRGYIAWWKPEGHVDQATE